MSTAKSYKTCLMDVYLQVILCDVGYKHYPLCMYACECGCVSVGLSECVCVCMCGV